MSAVDQLAAYQDVAHKNNDYKNDDNIDDFAPIVSSITNINAFKQKTYSNGDTPLITIAPQEDPYYYGWRYVEEGERDDGQISWRKVPLTQADFLNPQLGDQMVQSDQHFHVTQSIYNRFNNRHSRDDTIGIYCDVIMSWGIPGVSEPAPDLAIVPDLQTKGQYHGSFKIREEGTQPCLVLEVVSPRYPGDETNKVITYRQAGVQEYIILNPYFLDSSRRWELIGYQMDPSLPYYVPMTVDSEGRLYSQLTNTYWSIHDEYDDVIIVDGNTGEVLLDGEGEYNARLQWQRAYADSEAARIEVEVERDEIATERDEAQAHIQRLMEQLRSLGVDPE